MELIQLEMFVAVSEEGSFRLAAERVLRTPPAVSIGVRKLEEEIGSLLFVRSRRQSGKLTAKGEKLYDYAARLLRLRDEMWAALREDGEVAGFLRVGIARPPWERGIHLRAGGDHRHPVE